jgi:hypothetical protein
MTKESVEQQLRNTFEAELAGRIDRYMRSRVHPVIPDGFFSAASTECRKLFVDGNYYGCITLSQSVAEGLAKFVADKSGVDVVGKHRNQINELQKNRAAPTISNEAYAAFRQIIGRPHEDRDDFHHLNADLEQDHYKLESRALECLESLFAIESEVFAFQIVEGGRLRPMQPKYWPKDGQQLSAYVRFA